MNWELIGNIAFWAFVTGGAGVWLLEALSAALPSKPVRPGGMERIEYPKGELAVGYTDAPPPYLFRVPPYVGGQPDPENTEPLRVWESDYRSNGRGNKPTRLET